MASPLPAKNSEHFFERAFFRLTTNDCYAKLSGMQTISVSADFAAAVRERRLARGWTYAELSARSGVSGPMLFQIERRKSVPSLTVAEKIAGAFELPLAELLAADKPNKETARC
jgi:ribosome-binding protein aMBF1 (putative translation factor)